MRTPAGKHRRFSQVGYVRSPPILQVAPANRLIVGAALASPRRSIKFFVDEPCSSLTFFSLSTQEAPPEIPKSVTPFGSKPKPARQCSCLLPPLYSLFGNFFPPLSTLGADHYDDSPAHSRKSGNAAISDISRSKISFPTPTTTYNFNDYLAVLGTKSVFEMAHYKSTAQNPFGGLQAFLNDHRVLFSPSTLKTYFREDLISLATRVKDIFGLVDAWTVNIDNELPLVIDRARLTVFRNLRDAYDPSIFEEDAELRSWVSEEEEKALNQGLAQLISLADCKFGRPKTPFSTTITNEDGEEVGIEPDHSSINFGPPEKGEKFYLSPPIASSRRNPFTGGDGASTSKPPPPKPTRKSAFSGLETKSGAATPSNATKTATATRSAPGTTTSTRTSETTQKPPTKPAKTATKPATASKAPAKIIGGASKSSTPAPGRPLPQATIATKGATSTPSTTSTNTLKRTRDAIASEQDSTPASNLRATKERAARSRTLPAIAVLEGSPEPPPAKKQRVVKTEPAPNAQASSSTSVARTKTKRKAMAGEDDRGRWHCHYNDFPHVNKLPEVNPQPNYPNAQSLILAKRNGIFANVDTDPAPELRVVEAMAAYTDRVVNGPYPWKCDQCNAARKVCVFRGHSKKCDACASARNSCSTSTTPPELYAARFFQSRRTSSGWLLPINAEDEIPLKRYPSDSHLQVQLRPIWASTPGLLRRKSFNGWGSPQAYPGSWDSPVFEQNIVVEGPSSLDVSPLNYLRALGCYSDVREEVASTFQEGVLAEPIVSVAKLDQFNSDEEDQSDADMPPLQTPSDSGSDSGVELVY
ncbi:hypothetical protein K435DRAFT_878051 [Dendrothele bispora CBS 962.96]|uniref:Uncharacterized protein n=1 Tax=Dendrothele bispora (strain CBS 962.96) TaxID=1314807 RepID=A0A4S8KP02_DENBC|nr:hypothetical protein K435DRAFT_878051 [Dendrothele bispora CBS 962.96]